MSNHLREALQFILQNPTNRLHVEEVARNALAIPDVLPVAVQALKHCIFAMTSVNMLLNLPKEAKVQLYNYINEAEAALNTISTAMGGNRGEGNTPHSDR